MVYPGECFMCTWEECVFWWCWVECSVYTYLAYWILECCSSPPLSLLIFCIVVPSISGNGVLNSPTIILELFLPSIISSSFLYFGALLLGVHMFIIVIFLMYWPFYQYIIYFFISCNFSFYLMLILSNVSIATQLFFDNNFHEVSFLSFYFHTICIFGSTVSLL